MKVAELIAALRELPLGAEIFVLDGSNGGGCPREINLGPTTHKLTQEDIDDCADVDYMTKGTKVFVIGYGCY